MHAKLPVIDCADSSEVVCLPAPVTWSAAAARLHVPVPVNPTPVYATDSTGVRYGFQLDGLLATCEHM